jgi:hypothetical protein
MIPETQRKLDEALFFFKHLYKGAMGPPSNAPEFGYYLSAFLSAARSVTFVLQAEEKQHYDTWYPSWEARLVEDDRKLWKFMNDQRVAEVHQDGADVDRAMELRTVPQIFGMQGRALVRSAIETALPGQFGTPHVIFAPPLSPPVVEVVPIHRFRLGKRGVDVRDACAMYLDLLTALVREFIAVHS